MVPQEVKYGEVGASACHSKAWGHQVDNKDTARPQDDDTGPRELRRYF